jgi:hypothetical protein
LIEEVRLAFPCATPSEYALLFRKAYPFAVPSQGGPARMYKIWLDEIDQQTRAKEPLTTPRCENTVDLFAGR